MKKHYFLSLLMIGLSWFAKAQSVDLLYFDGCINEPYYLSIFSDFSTTDQMIFNYGDGSENDTVPGDTYDVAHTYTEANASGYDVTVSVLDASDNLLFDSLFAGIAIIADCNGSGNPDPDTRQPGLVNIDFELSSIMQTLPGCKGDSVEFSFYPAYSATDEITVSATGGAQGSLTITVPGDAQTARIYFEELGTYDITATVTNASSQTLATVSSPGALQVENCGEISIDRITFEITQFDPVCAGETTTFSFASTIGATERLVLDYGDGMIDTLQADDLFASHTYMSLDTFDIGVQVIDENGNFVNGNITEDAFAAINCGGFYLPCEITMDEPEVTCVTNSTIPISASVQGADSWAWSTNGAGTIEDTEAFMTNYTTPASENGKLVTFYIQTSGGSCGDSSISFTHVVYQPVQVADMPNFTICGSGSTELNYPETTLPTGTRWFGSLGDVAGATTANAIYQSNAKSEFKGTDTIYLGVLGNTCPNSFDTVVVTVNPSPKVFVGEDGTNFETEFDVSGTVSGATSTGVWTTSGTGSFDDSSSLTTTYSPTIDDKLNGSVTLTLTSTNNGECEAVSSSKNVLVADCDVQISNETMLTDNKISLSASYDNNSLNAAGKFVWVIDPVFDNEAILPRGDQLFWKALFGKHEKQIFGERTRYYFESLGAKKVYLLYADLDGSCVSFDSATYEVENIVERTYTIHGKVTIGGQPIESGGAKVFDLATALAAWGAAANSQKGPEVIVRNASITSSDNGNYAITNIQGIQYAYVTGEGQTSTSEYLKIYGTDGTYNNDYGMLIIDNDYEVNLDLLEETRTITQVDYLAKPSSSESRPQSVEGDDIIRGKVTITADTANPESNITAFVLDGAYVELLDTTGNLVEAITSNLFGGYTLRGIPAGVYRMKTSYLGENYGINDIYTDFFVVDGDSNTVDERDFRLIYRKDQDIVTGDYEDLTSEINLNNGLTIYPNPTKGTFQIILSEKVTEFDLVLYNSEGQLLKSQTGTSSDNIISVNAEGITPGLYVVKLITPFEEYTSKLIVE